ncbi:MAG: hypothetical protein ABSD44_07305 [Terracidiphilus sp.]
MKPMVMMSPGKKKSLDKILSRLLKMSMFGGEDAARSEHVTAHCVVRALAQRFGLQKSLICRQ